MNPSRQGEPCAYVQKMRWLGAWDRWCFVHNHWLNGAPAETLGDKMKRETKEAKR